MMRGFAISLVVLFSLLLIAVSAQGPQKWWVNGQWVLVDVDPNDNNNDGQQWIGGGETQWGDGHNNIHIIDQDPQENSNNEEQSQNPQNNNNEQVNSNNNDNESDNTNPWNNNDNNQNEIDNNDNSNQNVWSGLPDLITDPKSFNPFIGFGSFFGTECPYVEGCLTGTGSRKLLRFTTEIQNIGDEAVSLGAPSATNANFYFSPCRNSFVRQDYTSATLLDDQRSTVVQSRKHGYCLLDSGPIQNSNINSGGAEAFGCDNQGLSVGFSDDYASSIDCQWVDVTDLPDGNYTLIVEANANRWIKESNYDNNEAQIQVEIMGASVNTWN